MKVIQFEYVPKEGGYWAKLVFDNGTEWYPRLDDIGMICAMIGKCEDIKYANGRGCREPRDFILKCMKAIHKLVPELNFDTGTQLAIIETIYQAGFDKNGLYRKRDRNA